MQIVSSKGQIIQYMHAVKVMLQLIAQSAKEWKHIESAAEFIRWVLVVRSVCDGAIKKLK